MSRRKRWVGVQWLTGWVVLLAAGSVMANDVWVTLSPQGEPLTTEISAAVPPVVSVNAAAEQRLSVTVQLQGVSLQSRKTNGGEFVTVTWPDAAVLGGIGAPALPVHRRLFIAPAGAEVIVEVTVGDATTVDVQQLVMPRQAPVPKLPGARENALFDFDAAAYAATTDVPAERAVTQLLGVVRGQRVFALEVRPVGYNPAAGQLTLWPQIEVNITFRGSKQVESRLDPLPGLHRAVLNPAALPARRQAATTDGQYLVIVPSSFVATMADFVSAKQAQGYDVTTYEATPGTTAGQIKSYIESLWAVPETAPDFILLVGDTNTIPHWTGGGDGSPATDLPYSCMDGSSDWFPDIALGRFSAQTTGQLQTLIDKTLSYENGEFADTGYTARAVFMASQDNYTVSEGTHNYCIETHMQSNNIESDKLYCNTYNATTQQVSDAFNDGRMFGIYSGHGSTTSWADGPPFNQSNVNSLFNQNMYAWVCSFSCVTGTYTESECFMETWVRAPNKGAVAAWGSSVNSYWTEDDVLQRRLFDVLYFDYVRELGPLYNLTKVVYAGEMGSGSFTRRYFEMYNLMGDPSLYIVDAEAALRVSPGQDFVTEGPEGGPFDPNTMTYTVRNVADYTITYQVSHDPQVDWCTLSGPVSGTLLPQGTADITLQLNDNALALETGAHTDTMYFTNLTDHVGDTTRDIMLEVGRYVFNSTDVPKTINDYSTVQSVLEVEPHFCIADLDVDVDIAHTYIGDLVVTLESPSGTVVTLHDRSGGSTNNLQLRYDDEDLAPDGPGSLADFDLESPAGTWILTIQDEAGGDQGSLNAWSLRVLPAGDVCPPLAYDAELYTPANSPLDIQLEGSSQGQGPLDYIITLLPEHGTLEDLGGAGLIDAVPHILANHGSVVRYQPVYGYNGEDDLHFYVGDDSGESPEAVVSVTVGGPQPVHSFSMDSDPGWNTTEQWSFGQPAGQGSHNGDPSSGYTGNNVYGYNLSGDYPNNMTVCMYLRTGALDCSQVTGTELRFRRWLGIDSGTYDHANIQVSNNGLMWVTVWEHTGAAISDSSWTLQTLDISAVADNQERVFIRWGMGPTNGGTTYPGWNIDDVEIWGMAPQVCPGDLSPDGLVDASDLALLLGAWGPCADCPADLNQDAAVDAADLALLLGNWGSCG